MRTMTVGMRGAMTGAMIGGAALALAACSNQRMETGMPVANAMHATATIHDATGAAIGRATATDRRGRHPLYDRRARHAPPEHMARMFI